jgi:hypothetical protein
MRRISFVLVAALSVGCGRTWLDDDTPGGATLDASDAIAKDGPTAPRSDSGARDAGEPIDSEPIGVVDAAGVQPCLTGGNRFHVEGDPGDPVYPGVATIGPTDGTWSGMIVSTVMVNVLVDQGGSTSWAFGFSQLATQQAIQVGTYEDVGGPMDRLDKPTLVLHVDGRSCDQPRSRVTIASLETRGENDLVSLTATFEQHCGDIVPELRGCVHYQK